MKILVAHNAYQQRGGEDAVVKAEVALLRDAGHVVELLMRHNDELESMSRAETALQTLWSRRTTGEVRERLARLKPDVVHVHNTFPLLSPSFYWACAAAGVPVVQTLHNFRLACPQAMFLREGRVCEDCLGKLPVPAIRHGCYRGSRAQTAVLTGMLVLHRGLGTWQHKVARYIALSEFSRNKFIEAGLPADRVVVKPNFVDAPALAESPRAGFLFVGRLSPEKGVALLAQAMAQLSSSNLKVVGRGTETARLEGLGNVTMLGEQGRERVFSEMSEASALVVPSISYETFGLVVAEAFARGLPVIASRIGALAELVREGETGLLFTPGDAADLARVLAWAQAHPQELARMGREARLDYESHYTPASNLGQLLEVYRQAMALPLN